MTAQRTELEARLARLESWETRQARLGGLVLEARRYGRVTVEWELMRNFASYREEIASMLPCLVEYLAEWVCPKAAHWGGVLKTCAEVTDWLGAPGDHTADSHEAIVSAGALDWIVHLRRACVNLRDALMESWYDAR